MQLIVPDQKLNHALVYGKKPEDRSIMVYGFRHCHTSAVSSGFKRVGKVYDYSFSSSISIPSGKENLDESNLKKIERMDKALKRKCKAALVNVVLENLVRKRLGRPTIPVLFCVDCKDNPYLMTSRNLLSKANEMNDLITHKEIRRAYKLCFDPQVSTEVQQVAKEIFHFAKVVPSQMSEQTTLYLLKEIPPPWEDLEFSVELKKRKACCVASQIPPSRWRDHLQNRFNIIYY